MIRPCADCGVDTGGKERRFCPDHRWQHRKRPRKYLWTPEADAYLLAHYDVRNRGCTLRIAAHLGFPKHTVVKRAAALGLGRGTKEPNWTREQEDFVRAYAGRRTSNWIAKNMPGGKRTEVSVIQKMRRLQLSGRVRGGGYTLTQLEALLGIDHRKLVIYARRGILRMGQRTANHRSPRYITASAVFEFVRDHRELLDLRRVEQGAFLSLIFDGSMPQVAARPRKKAA